MSVNYQVIVDMIASMGMITFPIAILLCLADKFVDIFLTFVSGKRVKL